MDIDKSYRTYYIKARSAKHNLFIISIPKMCQSGEYAKEISNFLCDDIIPKRLNYIFITLEKEKKLTNNIFELLLIMLNLYEKKESIENKLMVFFSSDFSKENIPNEINKNIIFSE